MSLAGFYLDVFCCIRVLHLIIIMYPFLTLFRIHDAVDGTVFIMQTDDIALQINLPIINRMQLKLPY